MASQDSKLIDGLTGVPNYRAFMKQLDAAVEEAARKNESLSLTTFDVDYFKRLNDNYGHVAGDEALKKLANIYRDNFTGDNFVARIGGEEFAVIMPHTRAETAFVLAEEVRKLIAETEFTLGETEKVNITVSGGVAAYPNDAKESGVLLRKADEAMYRAKNTGRNRICLPTDEQMVTKTSHFTGTQLERLSELARKLGKSEAFLLREGLDDLFHKYDDSLRVDG